MRYTDGFKVKENDEFILLFYNYFAFKISTALED